MLPTVRRPPAFVFKPDKILNTLIAGEVVNI